jgi:hypothetical protein
VFAIWCGFALYLIQFCGIMQANVRVEVGTSAVKHQNWDSASLHKLDNFCMNLVNFDPVLHATFISKHCSAKHKLWRLLTTLPRQRTLDWSLQTTRNTGSDLFKFIYNGLDCIAMFLSMRVKTTKFSLNYYYHVQWPIAKHDLIW